MSVSVGIIGCGVMGADHARLLVATPGAKLAGVYDASPSRAAEVGSFAGDIRLFDSAAALIADPSVEAVLIASPDETHAPLSIACIEAGKPVLCEKPLAATLADCRAVISAEMKAGRRLVQVGFMRRFDPGYRAMKRSLDEEAYGQPLFLHCVHRNAVAPHYITSDLVIANSAVHEIDIARFLLAEEFLGATVVSARASRKAAGRKPQLIVLESASGVVVTIEAFLDAQYGYDVQAELVCEEGSIALSPLPAVANRHQRRQGYDVDEDWRTRFGEAYRVQLVEWTASILRGEAVGSSAWDGYAASATAGAALEALAKGGRIAIDIGERPAFYAR